MTSTAAHALWAETYDEAPNPLLALEQRVCAPLLPELQGRVAADIACGTGRWARQLAARGARVIGVDRSPEMLARAPRPAVIADACSIPLRDAVADLTICAFAFSYTGPHLDELARITRPGGVVIVSDMHPLAVQHGWKRSFRARGAVISISGIPYELESLRSPMLRAVEVIEAPFGEPERDVFLRAGKPHLFDAVSAVLAVFVAKWIRRAD